MSAAPHPYGTGMKSIIVFDYGPPRQRLLGWFLADTGIAVETLETLEEVIAVCHERRVPVVVLNSQVARTEALEITAKLKDHCPDATIFYLKADEDAGDPFDEAIRVCSTGDADALVAAIRDVLER